MLNQHHNVLWSRLVGIGGLSKTTHVKRKKHMIELKCALISTSQSIIPITKELLRNLMKNFVNKGRSHTWREWIETILEGKKQLCYTWWCLKSRFLKRNRTCFDSIKGRVKIMITNKEQRGCKLLQNFNSYL